MAAPINPNFTVGSKFREHDLESAKYDGARAADALHGGDVVSAEDDEKVVLDEGDSAGGAGSETFPDGGLRVSRMHLPTIRRRPV